MSEQEKPQRLGWIDETFVIPGSWDDYSNLLKIDENDLKKWPVIVDLGSSEGQALSRDVKKLGLENKVISLDPTLGFSKGERGKIATVRRQNARSDTIAAFAEELPLKSESVDAVFALFSVPYYSMNERDDLLSISEMIRVLKPGGEIRIFPYNYSNHPYVLEHLRVQPKDEIKYEFIEKPVSGSQTVDGLLIINKIIRETEKELAEQEKS